MKVSDALDANFIYAGDLDGKEVTLTIDRVAPRGTVKREDGQKVDKEVVYFKETKRGLALNKTNLRRLQLTHGNDMDKWTGKKITIFPTTIEMSLAMAEQAGCVVMGIQGKKATVPCIRVRVPAHLFEPVPLSGEPETQEEPEW